MVVEKVWTNKAKYVIMSLYGKCSKKSGNIIRYKGPAFYWANILRPSQGRSCANYCRNKQESNRIGQKIQYEAAACIFCGYNALNHLVLLGMLIIAKTKLQDCIFVQKKERRQEWS